MNKEQKKKYTFNFSEELIEMARVQAKKEMRNLSNFVEVTLRKYIMEQKKREDEKK